MSAHKCHKTRSFSQPPGMFVKWCSLLLRLCPPIICDNLLKHYKHLHPWETFLNWCGDDPHQDRDIQKMPQIENMTIQGIGRRGQREPSEDASQYFHVPPVIWQCFFRDLLLVLQSSELALLGGICLPKRETFGPGLSQGQTSMSHKYNSLPEMLPLPKPCTSE